MNFKIRYDIKENKTFIRCNSTLNTQINFYEWNSFTNNLELLYNTNSNRHCIPLNHAHTPAGGCITG